MKLVLIHAVTAPDLPIHLGASRPGALMLNPEVMEVPSEVRPELGTVVRLDSLDGHGEASAQLINEVDR